MTKQKIVVSVVICTYNRAPLVLNCLKSLDNQTADKNCFEVIIVDNNSSDNTNKVVENFIRKRVNFRIVREKKQGLSFARNRGWREARGKYIAYIDDDAIAKSDWVQQIMAFIKKNSKINAFGGPYGRFSSKPFPSWLPENYFTLNLGSIEKTIHLRKEWISGSNMIFNKSIFIKYGGFNTDLGMKGNRTLYGEETELLLRLKKMGESVYYVPKIRVKHLVAERKLSLWWLLKNNYWHSLSNSLFKKPKFNFLKGIVSLILSLSLIPLYLINKKMGVIKRRWYYGLSNIFLSLGQIAGSIYNVRYKLFNH
jgi:glycosyltransferase involved in cell wall biosynthesis